MEETVPPPPPPVAQPHMPPQSPGGTPCGAEKFADLMGKTEKQIDLSRLPENHRVVCFGCMVTMDFDATRLNIELNQKGRVGNIRCG